jgi:hypothetical protein
MRARKYLEQLGIIDPDSDVSRGDLVWFQAIAIGYSPRYLSENADGMPSRSLNGGSRDHRRKAAPKSTRYPVPRPGALFAW